MAEQSWRMIGDRYAVTGELGRGGMGVVWRSWDQVIGREVAIKELHLPDGLPPAERTVFEERVLREARTAGRLNDPGVVTVYDVLAEGGSTFIVMELMPSVTLSDLVQQHGTLPPEQVVEIARQVLSALETAHAAGVVHRDVKPSNIMVADGRVKLADFGIAHALDDPRVTTSGALVGSPSFMAPERLQGADATPASDMWSFGATLFFTVEGWLPFERQTTAATLTAVLNETPRLSKSHGVLGAVILGLLIVDPGARFAGEQVRTLLDSPPPQTSPSPQTSPQPVSPQPASERLDQAQPAPPRHGADPAPTRGPGRAWWFAAGALVLVVFVAGLVVGALAL